MELMTLCKRLDRSLTAMFLAVVLMSIAAGLLADDESNTQAAVHASDAARRQPQWVRVTGTENRSNGPTSWRFRRSFEADASIQSAQLRFAADFCRAEVIINGQMV